MEYILSLIDYPGKINATFYFVAPEYYAEIYKAKLSSLGKGL